MGYITFLCFNNFDDVTSFLAFIFTIIVLNYIVMIKLILMSSFSYGPMNTILNVIDLNRIYVQSTINQIILGNKKIQTKLLIN